MAKRPHDTAGPDDTARPDEHPAGWPDAALLRDCTQERGRASGPGGQRRNKVSTAIRLTHRPTGLTAQAGERREASVNLRVALRRLRFALAREVRWGWRGPSERWGRRVHDGRLELNPRHADAPALLGEALDAIDARGGVPEAATALGVTTTQLVKLLRIDPPAFEAVNRTRVARGKRPLR